MKILIVDDHAMIRSGLKDLLAQIPGAVLLEADSGHKALAIQQAEHPRMIVLDLNLPGVSGLELLRQLLEKDPGVRILVFSMHGEPVYAARALQIGAKGYVSKNASPEELRTAVARVGSGMSYVEADIAQQLAATPSSGDQRQQLTERDLEILRLLGEGRSYTDIAGALGLGYKTVANTATQIKSKLGVSRTADLIRLSVEMAIPRQGGS
jgi:DNA-binding NarL/FixJ family response regulator